MVSISNCSEENIARQRAFELCAILAGFPTQENCSTNENGLPKITPSRSGTINHSDIEKHCADRTIIEFMCRSGALEILFDEKHTSKFAMICRDAYNSAILYKPRSNQKNIDVEMLKKNTQKEIVQRINQSNCDFNSLTKDNT